LAWGWRALSRNLVAIDLLAAPSLTAMCRATSGHLRPYLSASAHVVGSWTLVGQDWQLITNKTGPTRLGFVLLSKFFERETRSSRTGGGAAGGGGRCGRSGVGVCRRVGVLHVEALDRRKTRVRPPALSCRSGQPSTPDSDPITGNPA